MPSTLKYYQVRPWMMAYYGARARCNNPNQKGYSSYGGKGIKFRMTLMDFRTLWERDQADQMKQPSIDRLDSNKDYVLGNCRYIEHLENSIKGTKKWQKAVEQRTLEGNLIKTFQSIYLASKEAGVSATHMGRKARVGGIIKGFKWIRMGR